jgi:hypothetical protein
MNNLTLTLTSKQLEYIQDGLIKILQDETVRKIQYPNIYNEIREKEVRNLLDVIDEM